MIRKVLDRFKRKHLGNIRTLGVRIALECLVDLNKNGITPTLPDYIEIIHLVQRETRVKYKTAKRYVLRAGFFLKGRRTLQILEDWSTQQKDSSKPEESC